MRNFLRQFICLINSYDLGDPRSTSGFPGLLTASPRAFCFTEDKQHIAIFPLLLLDIDCFSLTSNVLQ